MRGTRIVAAAAILAVSAALAACAPAAPAKAEVAVLFDGKNSGSEKIAAAELRHAIQADGYRVRLWFAGDDIPTQLDQVASAFDDHPAAVVISPVEPTSLGNSLDAATDLRIPVIAVDRLVVDTAAVSYFASFDQREAGRIQARSLLHGLGLMTADGKAVARPPAGSLPVELIAGSADDGQAADQYAGALEVLQPYLLSRRITVPSGKVEFEEVATLRANPSVAKARLAALVKKGIVLAGVLAPTDAIARAVLPVVDPAAAGGAAPATVIVTGGGAQLASVRSIGDGGQFSTVLEDRRKLAATVAEMVRAILHGETPETTPDADSDNGVRSVPTRLLAPVRVERGDIPDTIVDSGYFTASQLDG